jgi:hypothetical protein
MLEMKWVQKMDHAPGRVKSRNNYDGYQELQYRTGRLLHKGISDTVGEIKWSEWEAVEVSYD